MQISRGIIKKAQKVAIYGPAGIGKSTFAAQFPNPVFIDTEDSTMLMDVARMPKPSSWTMLLEQVKYFKTNPNACDTLVIDTADWAEKLCREHVCSSASKTSISDFSHGQGYVKLMEEFGKLLNQLTDIIELGVNAVIVAHATMRKFEQPDEAGAYDRWEMKLEKKVYPLVKEWADMVLFANYKTYVVNVDGQGAAKGKNKVQGGMRVMYASHHSCWDAKNRHGLPDEMEFHYPVIAHCFPQRGGKAEPQAPTPKQESKQAKPEPKQEPAAPTAPAISKEELKQAEIAFKTYNNIPKPLFDLMSTCGVDPEEIQKVVAKKGYYPEDTPIDKYDPAFIDGVLIGAWDQVYKMITDDRIMPF